MKIAITGATGLVGNLLGKELVDSGHALVALVRDPARARLDFPCTLVRWDANDSEPPREALKDVEAIVHLAGEGIAARRWTKGRKKALYDSRVKAAHSLRDGLAGRKIALFLTASGVGYYGDCGDDWLEVERAPGEDFLARLCVAWEAAADEIPAERVVKARFGVVLSAKGGFLDQVTPLFERFGASRLGSGTQWFSWIHGEDLARLLAAVVNGAQVRGPLNAVAPEPVTNAELTRQLGAAMNVRRAPPVPRIAMRIFYGEMGEALLTSQRARSSNVPGFEYRYPRLEQALNAIFLTR